MVEPLTWLPDGRGASLWALAAAALAAAGLLWRHHRAAPVAWLVLLAFVVAALQPRLVQTSVIEVRAERVALTGASQTELLASAAMAGPSSADLQLSLSGALTLPIANSDAAMGASARLDRAPLPFAPEELAVRLGSDCVQSRPCLLEVVVPNAPAARATLRIERAGREEFAAQVPVDGGVHSFTFTPQQDGGHSLSLRVEVDGVHVTANGRIEVAPAAPVLVIEPTGLVATALRVQGMHVAEAGDAPADWPPFAAVVLGVPLPEAAQASLARAVDDGMGLFVLEPAFGEPGEALRGLLPLLPAPRGEPGPGDGPGTQPGPPQPTDPPPDNTPPPPPTDEPPSPLSKDPKLVDKRLVAVALVVDRSGSMGNTLPNGRTKMSYAKTSALRTAAALGPGDEVVIVTFGNRDAGRVELPLTDASRADEVRDGAMRLAHAAEQTFLLSGLQRAAVELRTSKAAVRHIVVVSDGEFHLGESFALRSLAHELLTRDRISLSVIAIVDPQTSPEFRREAEELTRDGGGRFMPLDDAERVPTFVTAEVTQTLATVGREPAQAGGANPDPPPPQVEPPPRQPPPRVEPPPRSPVRLRVVAVAETPLLAPVPAEDWPALGSARAGTAPLEAEVLLVAGEAGWPLLAFANRGLGRVGAFAADLAGEAAREFRRDLQFPARLAQWVQHTMAPRVSPQSDAVLEAVVVSPRVPLPREVQALAALAGQEPVQAAWPAAGRDVEVRTTATIVPAWLLLALLVLLAAAERFVARLPA